jgi:hypothetical protein
VIGWLEKHMLPCAYKSMFGIDCPGCGFQRSCIALFRGDILKSLALYPATIPLIITAVFLLADMKFRFRNRKIIKNILYLSVATIVVVSYTIKMYLLATGHKVSA